MASKSSDPQTSTGSKIKISAKQVAGVVLLVLAVIFIVENGQHAKIRFIAGSRVSAYLWLALLIAAALGFIGGVLVSRARSKR
jgi:uncharacterized integral membrane protein